MTHSDWMLQIKLLYSTNQISSLKSRIVIQWCPGKVQILLVINNPKANYPFDHCQSSNLRPCDSLPMEDVLCLGLILSEPWLNGYGHEFESLHQTLDGSFFKFICHQILLTSQKTENKWKRGGRLPIYKKVIYLSFCEGVFKASGDVSKFSGFRIIGEISLHFFGRSRWLTLSDEWFLDEKGMEESGKCRRLLVSCQRRHRGPLHTSSYRSSRSLSSGFWKGIVTAVIVSRSMQDICKMYDACRQWHFNDAKSYRSHSAKRQSMPFC